LILNQRGIGNSKINVKGITDKTVPISQPMRIKGRFRKVIMTEELKPAETIIEPVQPAKVEVKDEVGKDAETQQKELKAQQKEKDAEFARRRREEERVKALEQRELDTAIKITGGVNPFTNEKIEDRADLEEFYLMKEIEKEGGDPLADFAKKLKLKRKEEQGKGKEVKMTEDQAKEDWHQFSLAHPEIKLNDLMADEDFLDYADGKIGNRPLAQIYDAYAKKWLGKKDGKKEEKTIVKQSPGSLGQTVTTPSEYYSKADSERLLNDPLALRKLQDTDFKKLQKSVEYWAKH